MQVTHKKVSDFFFSVKLNLSSRQVFVLFWLCLRYFCTHGQLGMWILASHSRTKTAMHGIVLCALLFFYNFLCDKLLNRCRATWNLFVKCNTCTVHICLHYKHVEVHVHQLQLTTQQCYNNARLYFAPQLTWSNQCNSSEAAKQ